MSDPLIHEYTTTNSNIKMIVPSIVKADIKKGEMTIMGTYLINSFSPGTLAVTYIATPEGGSASASAAATIKTATIGTNGVDVSAKNRKIKMTIVWEFYKDLLPNNYTSVCRLLIWTDTNNDTLTETIATTIDSRHNLVNAKSLTFGSDTTPSFEFSHPSVLKSINVKPVLEYGTDKTFAVVDHTITAFDVWNGTAFVGGDASTGNPVTYSSGQLKLRITATTVISGTEYYRIRLESVSFVA